MAAQSKTFIVVMFITRPCRGIRAFENYGQNATSLRVICSRRSMISDRQLNYAVITQQHTTNLVICTIKWVMLMKHLCKWTKCYELLDFISSYLLSWNSSTTYSYYVYVLFREIRECLKLDPDHKECFPFYKKAKKLVKQMQSVHNFINDKKWGDCITKAEAMLKTESEVFQFMQRAKGHICHCHAMVWLILAKNFKMFVF